MPKYTLGISLNMCLPLSEVFPILLLFRYDPGFQQSLDEWQNYWDVLINVCVVVNVCSKIRLSLKIGTLGLEWFSFHSRTEKMTHSSASNTEMLSSNLQTYSWVIALLSMRQKTVATPLSVREHELNSETGGRGVAVVLYVDLERWSLWTRTYLPAVEFVYRFHDAR